MIRPCSLLGLALVLALPALGCGARSSLLERTSGVTEITVADSHAAAGDSGRIAQFKDMKGTGWTTLTPSAGSIVIPCGPAVGASGAVYFADAIGSRIFSMKDMTGADLTSYGTPGPDPGQLISPIGVALDADEAIYIADVGGNRVVRINDISGAGLASFGTFGSGQGQLSGPRGVAISSKGQILVADFDNHRLVQVDDMTGAGWAEWTVPGTFELPATPFGVAYDSEDRIYTVDFDSSTVHRIDSIEGGGHVQFSSEKLTQASHVAVGPDGRIYLTLVNVGNAVARMDDMEGSGLVVYGGDGTGTGQFKNPCGLFVR